MWEIKVSSWLSVAVSSGEICLDEIHDVISWKYLRFLAVKWSILRISITISRNFILTFHLNPICRVTPLRFSGSHFENRPIINLHCLSVFPRPFVRCILSLSCLRIKNKVINKLICVDSSINQKFNCIELPVKISLSKDMPDSVVEFIFLLTLLVKHGLLAGILEVRHP